MPPSEYRLTLILTCASMPRPARPPQFQSGQPNRPRSRSRLPFGAQGMPGVVAAATRASGAPARPRARRSLRRRLASRRARRRADPRQPSQNHKRRGIDRRQGHRPERHGHARRGASPFSRGDADLHGRARQPRRDRRRALPSFTGPGRAITFRSIRLLRLKAAAASPWFP